MSVKNIDAKDFKSVVLDSKKPVLVDFYADWCMPCRMMEPVLEEFASKFGDKVEIVKINTEVGDNGYLAAAFQVRSIPNMKLFKNGKVDSEVLGFHSFDQLKTKLSSYLS